MARYFIIYIDIITVNFKILSFKSQLWNQRTVVFLSGYNNLYSPYVHLHTPWPSNSTAMYLTEIHPDGHLKTHSRMFVTALFKITKYFLYSYPMPKRVKKNFFECLLNEIIYSNNNEFTTTARNSADESHKHNVEWKKPDIREYTSITPFI